MKRLMMRAAALAALLIQFAPALAAQDKKFEVRLKKAWAQAYADRAAIDVSMLVKWTHKSPNRIESGGKDGDMHVSGEAREIGLPFVAEVVNAAMPGQRQAVNQLKQSQEDVTRVPVSGAWRLWFEHPAVKQTQGGRNAFDPDNTNPAHSFEIHPVTKVAAFDVSRSFVPIPSYSAHSAEVAFPYFDKIEVTIKASRSAISIRSKQLKYNYVEFDIELAHRPQPLQDGLVALASIVGDGDEKVIADERRMVFVGGTPPASAISNAAPGDRFTVLGIPRVSLAGVLELVARKGTAQFDAALPYEMIIVGVKP